MQMGHDGSLAAARFRLALQLYDFGEQMLRQRSRRKHPGATAAQIDEWVAQWLERRPGAEDGDAQGRKVPWPRPGR